MKLIKIPRGKITSSLLFSLSFQCQVHLLKRCELWKYTRSAFPSCQEGYSTRPSTVSLSCTRQFLSPDSGHWRWKLAAEELDLWRRRWINSPRLILPRMFPTCVWSACQALLHDALSSSRKIAELGSAANPREKRAGPGVSSSHWPRQMAREKEGERRGDRFSRLVSGHQVSAHLS